MFQENFLMDIMVTRVHFCAKCGRPIPKAGYCEDCAAEIAAGIYHRCSFCGKSSLMSPLAYNKKTRKVYCRDCLNVFVSELRKNGIPEHQINKILIRDFMPVR